MISPRRVHDGRSARAIACPAVVIVAGAVIGLAMPVINTGSLYT